MRERREIRNSFYWFWLVCFIGLPNPSLYSYGRPGFPSLKWPPWPSGLISEARSTTPTRPRRLQIRFLSINHNSQHFILGIGRATKKLQVSVILNHHRTNITLSQKITIPKSSWTSPVAYIPFMPDDISFDCMLNIIAQANMVKMDRFFLKRSWYLILT